MSSWKASAAKECPEDCSGPRRAIVFNTSNTLAEREKNAFGDPLQTIWKNCIFGLCDVADFYRKTYCVVVTSNEQQRAVWLDDVRAKVNENFPG